MNTVAAMNRGNTLASWRNHHELTKMYYRVATKMVTLRIIQIRLPSLRIPAAMFRCLGNRSAIPTADRAAPQDTIATRYQPSPAVDRKKASKLPQPTQPTNISSHATGSWLGSRNILENMPLCALLDWEDPAVIPSITSPASQHRAPASVAAPLGYRCAPPSRARLAAHCTPKCVASALACRTHPILRSSPCSVRLACDSGRMSLLHFCP